MFLLKVKCAWCGKEFDCTPSRYKASKSKAFCCSVECGSQYRKSLTLNCQCEVCGKKLHRKPYAIKKQKHVYCSQKCANIAKEKLYSGEGNPRYGFRGELCPMWKGGRHETNYGYIEVYAPEHPFVPKDGYMLEHRLVAEQYLLTDENSIEVNGKRYLKPEYEVHHIDFDRRNNSPENLLVLIHKDHVGLHNKLNSNNRNEKGQYMKRVDPIRIKRITETAMMPERKSIGAAGYDLYVDTNEDVVIPPHSSVLLPTGIAFSIKSPYFGAIYARSGLSTKKGLRPATCVSVIDSDYRGEVKIPLHNDTDTEKVIVPHERVAQIVFEKALICPIVEVEELDETDRGVGGFGSSGQK